MDNTILYTAKFTHHDLRFHKVWWKSDKRFGSWSGQTDRQTVKLSILRDPNMKMCTLVVHPGPLRFSRVMPVWICHSSGSL
jgi:hypothetical protein